MGRIFYNLRLKREINYNLGTGFVVHWCKVSIFKRVYKLMSGIFYIGLMVPGFILFFGM